MTGFNEDIFFELSGIGNTLKDNGKALNEVNKNLEREYKLEHYKYMKTIYNKTIYNEEAINKIKDFLGKPLIKFIEYIKSMGFFKGRNYIDTFIWDNYNYHHEKENYLDEKMFFFGCKENLDKDMQALGIYLKYHLDSPIKIDYHLFGKFEPELNNVILCAAMVFEIYNNPVEDNQIKYDYHTKPRCECLFCQPNCIIWKSK